MVMLFPDTADRTPRFHTTSQAYGEFYRHANCVTPTYNFRHCAYERRIREHQRELDDAKSCFDNIEWSKSAHAIKWRHGRGPCCFELVTARPAVRCEVKPVTHKTECIPVKHEFLEDHVNYCHPRIAPKPKFLQKTLFGRSYRPMDQSRASTEVKSEEGFDVGNAMKRRLRPVVAAENGEYYRPQLPDKFKVIPTSSRYSFYRYYGHGGKGAKSTKAHYPQNEFQPSQQASSLHDPPAGS
ncbi:uncharacterized protein [Physcomitrium patens]|uniref:uncharacterized protein n=1 Tax=Physcomitrium patens TaxID=3218 RepID=UPI000D153FAA|nr:uncharacterized protein LOC112275117 [Physcomitrium patens]|eukprot:XP_024360926.1 uncharacterized protein LOC112275117 [Physcomitrella patens]